ncbi:MAG: hypothetical protein JO323_00515 [Acidobacteriia bacterium]|nr:hypothetical protein [Terriglobia bacterium]
MLHNRVLSGRLCFLAAAACVSAAAQSVISTHAGTVYFFEGAVSLGGQPLEQKFGRFPDIGEGNELRTEKGRAEVLLTPGVFLRVGENSAIRLVSSSLSNSRVELLAGSAIVQSGEATGSAPPVLVYKDWSVKLPGLGVYRIDSEPARVRALKGHAEVSSLAGGEPIRVEEGQTLPLAVVLLTEKSGFAGDDQFENWAMARSQVVDADNTTAALISDDPSLPSASGIDLAGFSYFPLTGIPALGLVSPYGLSFWSPYQSTLNSLYWQRYGIGTSYGLGLSGIRYPQLHPIGSGVPSSLGWGLRTGGISSPRAPMGSPVRGVPHAPVAHPIGHPAGHR